MNPPARSPQLSLDIGLNDDATLDNYLVGSDEAAMLEQLSRVPNRDTESSIFLHGVADSGKSHLLQGACLALGHDAVYLPLEEIHHYRPADVVSGLEHLGRLCVDDLQVIAGKSAWEEALFHLINRARETGCQLVFAADQPPRGLALELEDLRSRLSWGLIGALPAPDDQRREAILQFRAARRGLTMSGEVTRYLLSRASRDMTQLIGLLDTLDREALAQQRALTVPFVKACLGW